MTESDAQTRCGFVALVGRPNVGKSTLLNRILEQKVSITSRKAQTTRHQITGVLTRDLIQICFVDTPGMHREEKRELNRVLNRTSRSALQDADVLVLVVEATKWTDEDAHVCDLVRSAGTPAILAINKIDQLRDKSVLLPFIQKLSKFADWKEIVPLSAEQGDQVEAFIDTLARFMPASEFLFPEDQITNRSVRFLAAEIIREKIVRQMGDEIPYNIAVEIERFQQAGDLVTIHGLIWVEREGQKKMVIGSGGEKLKRIGIDARGDIERMLDSRVMLNLWVKVKSGWSNNERALRSLGYDES